MCKISDYPGLYAKTDEYLRRESINHTIPGYEFLRKAIVIRKVEGRILSEELFEKIKEGSVVPANEKKPDDRDDVEQWMLEAIRSAGIDISVESFIDQIANEISL